MRILSRKALISFWTRHATSEPSLKNWYKVVRAAGWRSFADTRRTYSSVDQVKVESVNLVTVFNVGGNNDRIVAAIRYNTQTVYVLRVLTYAEYDKERWKKQL